MPGKTSRMGPGEMGVKPSEGPTDRVTNRTSVTLKPGDMTSLDMADSVGFLCRGKATLGAVVNPIFLHQPRAHLRIPILAKLRQLYMNITPGLHSTYHVVYEAFTCSQKIQFINREVLEHVWGKFLL